MLDLKEAWEEEGPANQPSSANIVLPIEEDFKSYLLSAIVPFTFIISSSGPGSLEKFIPFHWGEP